MCLLIAALFFQKLNVHFLNKCFILIAYFSEKAFDKAFQLEDNADPNAGGGGGGGAGGGAALWGGGGLASRWEVVRQRRRLSTPTACFRQTCAPPGRRKMAWGGEFSPVGRRREGGG